MELGKPEEDSNGLDSSEGSNQDANENSKSKVGQFLGVEISAPTEMKNPLLRLFGLIFLNILLLIFIQKVLIK